MVLINWLEELKRLVTGRVIGPAATRPSRAIGRSSYGLSADGQFRTILIEAPSHRDMHEYVFYWARNRIAAGTRDPPAPSADWIS
jgi:hypothetical protein